MLKNIKKYITIILNCHNITVCSVFLIKANKCSLGMHSFKNMSSLADVGIHTEYQLKQFLFSKECQCMFVPDMFFLTQEE